MAGRPVFCYHLCRKGGAALDKVDFDSGTEFSRAIDGRDAYAVWEIMDELLSVLQATNPRLYDGVMRKIEQI